MNPIVKNPYVHEDLYTSIKNHHLFDPVYYKAKYPDIARSGVDPLKHYIDHGLREKRQGHPDFLFENIGHLKNYIDMLSVSRSKATHRTFISYPPLSHIKITAIIPTIWKRRDLTLKMIDFLKSKNIDIVIVDNTPQSLDGLSSPIKDVKHLHYPIPFNFSKLNNYGASFCADDSTLFLFMNDDLEVIQDDWLEKLVEPFADPSVGIVSPLVHLPNESVPGAGARMRLEDSGVIGVHTIPSDLLCVQTVGGACVAIRCDVFNNINGFDEDFIITHSDTALGLNVNRLKMKVLVTPFSKIRHYERSSRPKADLPQDTQTFWRKYGEDILMGVSNEPLSAKVSLLNSSYIDYTKVKTGLIIKMDHLGDISISLPAIKELVDKFPTTEWTVLCGSWGESIFRNEGYNNIIVVNIFGENGVMGGFKGLSLDDRARLSSLSFDIAADFRASGESRFLLNVIDAKIKVGYPTNAFTPTYPFPLHNDYRTVHNSRQLHWMVNNIQTYNGSVKRPIKRIALVPATSSPHKQWRSNYWIELGRILKRANFPCILAGGPNDMPLLQSISNMTTIPIMPVGEIGRFAKRIGEVADLAVVLDSGPGHLIASSGLPTVEIMGGIVPVAQWQAYGPNVRTLTVPVSCTPCYSNLKCNGRLDCLDVPVYDVVRTIGQFISESIN